MPVILPQTRLLIKTVFPAPRHKILMANNEASLNDFWAPNTGYSHRSSFI
jgi:hypothetical protein